MTDKLTAADLLDIANGGTVTVNGRQVFEEVIGGVRCYTIRTPGRGDKSCTVATTNLEQLNVFLECD